MRRSMASSRRTMRNCTRGRPRVGYPSGGGRTPRRLARIRRRTHASVSRTCSAARRRYQAEIGSCWPRVRPSCSAKRTAVRGTRNFNRSFKHSSLEPRLVVQEPDTSPRSLFDTRTAHHCPLAKSRHHTVTSMSTISATHHHRARRGSRDEGDRRQRAERALGERRRRDGVYVAGRLGQLLLGCACGDGRLVGAWQRLERSDDGFGG